MDPQVLPWLFAQTEMKLATLFEIIFIKWVILLLSNIQEKILEKLACCQFTHIIAYSHLANIFLSCFVGCHAQQGTAIALLTTISTLIWNLSSVNSYLHISSFFYPLCLILTFLFIGTCIILCKTCEIFNGSFYKNYIFICIYIHVCIFMNLYIYGWYMHTHTKNSDGKTSISCSHKLPLVM